MSHPEFISFFLFITHSMFDSLPKGESIHLRLSRFIFALGIGARANNFLFCLVAKSLTTPGWNTDFRVFFVLLLNRTFFSQLPMSLCCSSSLWLFLQQWKKKPLNVTPSSVMLKTSRRVDIYSSVRAADPPPYTCFLCESGLYLVKSIFFFKPNFTSLCTLMLNILSGFARTLYPIYLFLFVIEDKSKELFIEMSLWSWGVEKSEESECTALWCCLSSPVSVQGKNVLLWPNCLFCTDEKNTS